jgi:D-alanine-D-alanine ligase
MRIGLAFDLKTTVTKHNSVDDALEEYDSPETIEVITNAFQAKGHDIIMLSGGLQFLENIRREKVDIVFNIAEGRGNYRSREAQVPSILEMLDIPYTGSDPECLATSLDKPLTKKLVVVEGIATPKWIVVSTEDELGKVDWGGFSFPAIVKPAYEGSSKGIRLTSIVDTKNKAEKETGRIIKDYKQPVMIEEFIDGDEITVGVIGNSPPKLVGMMRILPKKKEKHFVYSLEVKRDYINLVEYESPVRLPKRVLEKLETDSLQVFKILGCRDFARIDFRVNPGGIPYFLEINPLPGLGTYSDLIIMAVKLGWTHEDVIRSVFDAAVKRYPQCINA